jgi:hypothetical protein
MDLCENPKQTETEQPPLKTAWQVQHLLNRLFWGRFLFFSTLFTEQFLDLSLKPFERQSA